MSNGKPPYRALLPERGTKPMNRRLLLGGAAALAIAGSTEARGAQPQYQPNTPYALTFGGTPRNPTQRALDFGINVEEFGAHPSYTSAVNTPAIQAALNYANSSGLKEVFFPGLYRVNATLSIYGSGWALLGFSKRTSGFLIENDGDCLRIDISQYESDLGEVRDLQFTWAGSGAPAAATGISFWSGGASTVQAATLWNFENLQFRGVYYGMHFCKAIDTLYQGVSQIAGYGQNRFINFDCPYSSPGIYEVVHYDSGPGAHNTFQGGTWAASHACLNMGDSIDGLGDQLISGIHMINAQYGFIITGPTAGQSGDPASFQRYNQNVTVTGCQMDGITVALGLWQNMQNFRCVNNQGTSAVGWSVINSQKYLLASLNAEGYQTAIPGKGYAAGTVSGGLFDIIRAIPSSMYESVYVEVTLGILVQGLGEYTLIWRGQIAFSATTGVRISVIENIITAPTGATYAASNISLSVAQQGTDRARGTVSFVSSPSTAAIDGDLRFMGGAAYVALL